MPGLRVRVPFALRRATAAEWQASNTILLEGEPGHEKDTRKLKVGDGVSAWNDLPYVAGEVGQQGPTGPTGPAGVKGDTGNTGPSGAAGPQGPVGPQGPQGSQGPQGIQGSQGLKGDTGDIGPAGPQGLKGDKGDQGDTGATGPQGPQGATGPAGPAGADSTVPGPQGPKGDTGNAGAQGNQGIQGIQGPAGPNMVVASTLQKAETGADTNLLTYTPAASAGIYRISVCLDVSAASSATLGFTATWKNSNGAAQAPTNLSLFKTGTAAPALTFSAAANGVYHATTVISVDNSATNIVVKTTFSGTSVAYKASVTIERLV